MAEFGERVLYIPLRGDVTDKRTAKINLEPRFQDGIFLGVTDRSDEAIVFGPEGIRKARTIRRRPLGEQWSKEELLAVRGTPLQPNPHSEDGRIRTRMEPGVAVGDVLGDPVTKQDIQKELGEQRRFQLTRENVKEVASRLGYT